MTSAKLDPEVQVAVAELQKGSSSSAAEKLRTYLEYHGRDADAWHYYGLACFEMHDKKAAVASVRKAIEIENKAVYWGNLGTIYLGCDKPREAEDAFRRALALKPDYVNAYVRLGTLCQTEGRIQEAEEAFTKALAINGAQPILCCYLAMIYEQTGRLEEAEASFRRALLLKPDYAEAHNDLGLFLRNRSRFDESLVCIDQALALRPNCAEFLNNKGVVLRVLGRNDEAEKLYERALLIKPDYPDAWNNYGAILKDAGALEKAEKAFRTALRLDDAHVGVLNNLAVMLQEKGEDDEAESRYKRILRLDPTYAKAYSNYGALLHKKKRFEEAEFHFRRALHFNPSDAPACNNFALLLYDLNRLDEAEALCRKAIEIMPNFADAWSNLGLVLHDKKDKDGAESCYKKALEINPAQGDVWNNYGVICVEQRRYEEGERYYRRSLELKPDHPDAYNNLGVLLKDMQKFDEAEAAYRHALDLRPDFPDARHNLALSLLRQGRMKEAWPFFEARYQGGLTDRAAPRLPDYPIPMWQGEPLAGKRLLITAEQAYGDEIQFVRFAALAKEQGAEVWLFTRPAVKDLMETMPAIDAVFTELSDEEIRSCDYWIFEQSMPYRFDTDMTHIPVPMPYFVPPQDKIDAWKKWIGDGLKQKGTTKKRLVGLIWAGNPEPPNRSLAFAQIAFLEQMKDVTFVSFQMGEAAQQKASAPAKMSILDAGPEIKTFLDSAALMTHLDLMITIDSGPAHLAGALGIPVWVMVQAVPDWRWFMNRADSPWYPSMRLIRQSRTGDWSSALEELKKAALAF